jgi:hypothetical protein
MVQTLLKQTHLKDNKDVRVYGDRNGAIPLHMGAQSENIQVCKELLVHNGKQQVAMKRTVCLVSGVHAHIATGHR